MCPLASSFSLGGHWLFKRQISIANDFYAGSDRTQRLLAIYLTEGATPAQSTSGHREPFIPCPLYPQKRTSVGHHAMSAKCQKRTWHHYKNPGTLPGALLSELLS